jgi:site-specific DNA recombinase
MNAAIYARRSHEQNVADEAKSVTRQIENARAFAAQRGWTVADEHVYVDDGISGAEFEKRPGLQGMLAAAGRRDFASLVTSEQKQIGREMTEVAYILKRLAKVGVEVWSYMEDRCLTPRNPKDKLLSSVQGYADEDHRVKTAERMHEAHSRLARAGRVTGGRCFGFRRKKVFSGTDRDGNPLYSHTECEINQEEAAVIRRIFELFGVEELGLKSIARQLNAEGAPAPRPYHRKDGSLPAPAWATSTVREILGRSIYVGRPTWGKYKKRDEWGQVRASRRPESEWTRAERPDLRIVSDELWNRVQARRSKFGERALRFSSGRLAGRPPRDGAINLLASLAACAVCGSGLVVETSSGPLLDAFAADALPAPGDAPAQRRGEPYRFYRCYSNRHKGASSCANALRVRADDMHEAVLQAVEQHVLTPEAIEAVITLSERDESQRRRAVLEREEKGLGRKIQRLVDAVADGADAKALLEGLRKLEAQRDGVRAKLAALRPLPRLPIKIVESRLADWRRMLRANPTQGREVLRRVLKGRIRFTPRGDGYEFECPTRFDRLFAGIVAPRPAFVARGDLRGTEQIRSRDTFDAGYERVLERAEDQKDGKLGDKMATLVGFEPTISTLKGSRAGPLHHRVDGLNITR